MSHLSHPGVYAIIHPESGRLYIGSSKNIYSRWKGHLSDLRRGIHHCAPLQNAWSKYGEAAFRFEVVESCLKDAVMLYCREQHWLDKYKGVLFNVSPHATPAYQRKMTEKHKESLRSAVKGNQFSKGWHFSKNLTERKAVEIMHRFAAGESRTDLAERFSVSLNSIQRIVARETWQGIKIDPRVEAACLAMRGRNGVVEGVRKAKLDWGKVDDIRRRRANGETVSTLSQSFGVAEVTIRNVATGRTWVRRPVIVVDLPPPEPEQPPVKIPKPPKPSKQRIYVSRPRPDRVILSCETCGARISKQPCHVHPRNFCSRQCANIGNSAAMLRHWSDPTARARHAAKVAKLKDEDIGPIRERLKAGETLTSLSRSFGVSREAIQDIKEGKTWKHVK